MNARFMSAMGWIAVLAGLVLAGCADKLPLSPLPVIKPTVTAEVNWKSSLGKTDEGFLVPALRDHQLYVASEKGQLTAINPDNGKTIWSLSTGEEFSAGVGVGEHAIFMGNKKGDVLAWIPSGQFLWRTALSSELMVPPQAADGVVVARTADGKIVGLNEADGKVLWTQTRSMPPLVLRGVSGMTLGNGQAAISLPGGKLVQMSLTDGTVLWESMVSNSHGATELERMNDVLGDPLVGSGMVCTVSYQGRAGCFETEHGQLIWSREVDAYGPLVEAGGQLVLSTTKSDVMGLDRITGNVLWKTQSLEGRYLSAPTVTASYVVIGDAEGVLHFLKRENGAEVGRLALDKEPIVQAPLFLGDDRVLVTNRSGTMFAVTSHDNH
jgi:outer membrane assembly lipoprotein YfgL